MKAIIGIYNDHKDAIKAVKLLKGEDFPAKDISLLGKTHMNEAEEVKKIEKKIGRIDEDNPAEEIPLAAGAILGPVLGVLTGVGVFVIPGFGFLYGAGALIGAIGGLDLGLVSGGIITLLATLGIHKKHHLKFEEHLSKGKAMLFATGNKEDLEKAEMILKKYNKHHELIVH